MKIETSRLETHITDVVHSEVTDSADSSQNVKIANPKNFLKWDDHLATALPASGRSAEETVREDREERW